MCVEKKLSRVAWSITEGCKCSNMKIGTVGIAACEPYDRDGTKYVRVKYEFGEFEERLNDLILVLDI